MNKDRKQIPDGAEPSLSQGKSVSRREFLKIAGVAGATIGLGGALGGLVAACGEEETTTTAGVITTAGPATTAAQTTTTAAQTTTTAAAGPILLGCPFPNTGWAGADALEQDRAMRMAVKALNDKGGVLGRPVDYMVQDVVNWEAEYQTAARDFFMGKGVDVFFPGWGGDPAFMDIFAAENTGGIPYWHYGTTELFAQMHSEDPEKYWNILQVDDTSRCYGGNAYAVFCKSLPAVYNYPTKTIAILTSDNTYNKEVSAGYRKLVEADPDWEIVIDEIHPYGAQDFGVQLAKVRDADPGMIFFSTVTVPEAVAFTNQFLDNPTQSLVHIQYAPSSAEYRRLMGEKSVGILWQTLIGANPTKESAAYREAYIETCGVAPGQCASYHQYDEVMQWAEAVEAVGDVKDYKGIVEYAYSTGIKGMTYGPGGLNMDRLYGTDRTSLDPYTPLPPGSNIRPGVENGSSLHYYEIQNTSDGPQDILVYMHGIPTEEYMDKYYGYPAQGKYVQELGFAKFQPPPWIKSA